MLGESVRNSVCTNVWNSVCISSSIGSWYSVWDSIFAVCSDASDSNTTIADIIMRSIEERDNAR